MLLPETKVDKPSDETHFFRFPLRGLFLFTFFLRSLLFQLLSLIYFLLELNPLLPFFFFVKQIRKITVYCLSFWIETLLYFLNHNLFKEFFFSIPSSQVVYQHIFILIMKNKKNPPESRGGFRGHIYIELFGRKVVLLELQ